MSISVVIPLFNSEKYILRAVNSVLCQTFNEFELIIVNDGSTDKSLELVASLEDSRIVIINQQNQGVSAARNRGIQEAKGEWIAFLDADDEWLPDFLKEVDKCVKETDCVAVSSNSYYETKAYKPRFPVKMKYSNPLNYFDAVRSGLFFHTSSTVVKKHILEKIGCFPVGISVGEDNDTWLRIGVVGEVSFISKPLAKYHLIYDSLSTGHYPTTRDYPRPAITYKEWTKKGLVSKENQGKYLDCVANHTLYHLDKVRYVNEDRLSCVRMAFRHFGICLMKEKEFSDLMESCLPIRGRFVTQYFIRIFIAFSAYCRSMFGARVH
jgi:glycosyltransferase involved in cell wall biosynthesis